MKRPFLTLCILVLGILACSTQVPTNALGTAPIATPNALGSPEKPVPAPSALGKQELGELATVTAYQSLHVRAARGLQAIVIGYLYHGDTVTLTGQCDRGWAEIVWHDGTAWVNADFLSSNKCSEEK